MLRRICLTGVRFALIVLLKAHLYSTQTGPNFCSYADGVFTCNYATMGSGDRPIDYSQFSTPPQRLVVTVNGFVPFFGDTRLFSESFSGIVTSGFDQNYPAELTIECPSAGSVFFMSGAFFNMSYVQHLKIKNCNTYNLPASIFEDINELDYFGFENGVIDVVDPNAMAGLDIKKLTSDPHQVPRNLGKFEIMKTKFLDKKVPAGLLYSWKFLSEITLKGADIETLTTDVFLYNKEIRMIDLSDNPFTSLPNNIFFGLNNLSQVTLNNIDWNCACTDLWFLDYATENGITLRGDFVCANIPNNTLYRYWNENCVETDICYGQIGLDFGTHCQSLFGILSLLLSMCATVSLSVAVVWNINMLQSPEVVTQDIEGATKYRKRIGNMWRSAACRIMMRKRREDRERGERLKQILKGDDVISDQSTGQKQPNITINYHVSFPIDYGDASYQTFSPAQSEYVYPGEITPTEEEFNLYNYQYPPRESSPFGGISVPRRSNRTFGGNNPGRNGVTGIGGYNNVSRDRF